MNRRKKFSFPCKLWSWQSVEGGGKLMIASTFDGSTQMPDFETINPKNHPDCMKKAHL